MTKQEAIERIRLVHCWTDINNNPTINTCECSLYMNNDGLCEDCEYHIAIECIEKQIPTKPTLGGAYKVNEWECPNCKSYFAELNDRPRHCVECGQAILWESDNND